MLSRADADLVARDAAVPGLATLLDPDAFLEAIAAASGRAPFERAVPRYLRYKAGTNCLVAYRLLGPGGEAEVHAKAHGRDAPEKVDKSGERSGVPGPLGWSRLALPERGIVVAAFPNDDKLPVLERLGDRDARRRLLARVLPDREACWDGALETLRYKPERRYVARLTASDGARVALKFTSEEDFAGTSQNAKRYRSEGALRLPERLGALASHSVLALEWIDGEPLDAAIAAGRAGACAQVGEALAGIHARRGRKLPPRAPEALAALAAAQADALARLWPPHAGRAAALARRIAAALPPADDARMVHGDFYDRQVLLCADRVAILDLDRAACASPLLDLGSFLARLLRQRAEGELSEARAGEAASALLDGWAAARGAPPAAGLAACTALALLQLAVEPFREHAPEWPERIGALLGCAEAALAGAALPS